MTISTAAKTELERIRLKSRKKVLMPEAVVKFAENPDSALHKYFEWDDSEAAAQFRLRQAQRVIQLCVTVQAHPSAGSIKIRTYCSLPSDRGKNGYRAIAEVRRRPEQYEELMDCALRELRIFQAKYSALSQLQSIMDAIDSVLGQEAVPA